MELTPPAAIGNWDGHAREFSILKKVLSGTEIDGHAIGTLLRWRDDV